MDITGKVPLVLYQEINNNENLIHGGSDIDIKISSQGKVTELYAITLGNGKWEINELDDSLNIFPEYSESDVISLDVLKKVLNQAAISSSKIFSFNLLGKVKYGLKDYGDKKAKEREEFKKKLKKKMDWFTDDIDKDTAQEFLTKKYGTTCKVGKVDKVNSIDGATFKVLFGIPKDKTFHINAIHRNGNDIRLVEDEPDFPMWQSDDGNEAIEFYDNYGKTVDNTEETTENNNEKNDNYEKTVDNPKEGEKGFKGNADGVEYEILEALKRKKKSKYNGCNVTGYEDGTMLNMASSSRHLFSKLLSK